MTRKPKAEPGQKQANSDRRRARLEQELRANLLKRKAQAKARASSARKGDEGRQS
jgi:hypothetical protein